LEIGVWDTSQQFVPKFVGCGLDLRNHALGAPAEQNHFAAPIVWRICARNPSFTLQPMQ